MMTDATYEFSPRTLALLDVQADEIDIAFQAEELRRRAHTINTIPGHRAVGWGSSWSWSSGVPMQHRVTCSCGAELEGEKGTDYLMADHLDEVEASDG